MSCGGKSLLRKRKVYLKEEIERLLIGESTNWELPNRFKFNTLNNYTQIGNVTIVRDDMLNTGTKSRWILQTISKPEFAHVTNFVYVGSPYGHAGMVLAQGVHWLNELRQSQRTQGVQSAVAPSARAILFMPISATNNISKNIPLPYLEVAEYLGAMIFYVENPYEEAVHFVNSHGGHGDSILLPSGFDTPEVRLGLKRMAKEIIEEFGMFDEFWYATGSGTIIRALHDTGLAKKYYGVVVNVDDYHHNNYDNGDNNYENVHYIKHDQIMDDLVCINNVPPFPSVSNFDAKAWKYAWKRASVDNKRVIFWNVV